MERKHDRDDVKRTIGRMVRTATVRRLASLKKARQDIRVPEGQGTGTSVDFRFVNTTGKTRGLWRLSRKTIYQLLVHKTRRRICTISVT